MPKLLDLDPFAIEIARDMDVVVDARLGRTTKVKRLLSYADVERLIQTYKNNERRCWPNIR